MQKKFSGRYNSRQLKRRAIVLSVCAVLAAIILFIFPQMLASGLNLLGLRGNVAFTVIDKVQNTPLADIPVTIGSQTERTDRSGNVSFEDVRLGNQAINIEIGGYASFNDDYDIGWRDNEQQELPLEPTGTTYIFFARDWLSAQPISGAEITHESRRAYADDEGRAFLTIDVPASRETVFTINAEGYVEQAVTPLAGDIDTTLDMVINEKHYFVARRGSRQSVFSVLADGSERQLVYEGQSDTTDDMQLSLQPRRRLAALVSTAVGSSESDLRLLNLEVGEAETIDKSKYLKVIGWVNQSLVYIKENDGATSQDPERFSLVAYDTETENMRIIESSNLFYDVLATQDYVFYAPSALYEENATPRLYRTRVDGGNPLVVIDGPVWSIVRSGFDRLGYFANNTWYEGALDSTSPSVSERASEAVDRLYTPNPYNGSLAVWVEFSGDGVGKLHLHEHTSDSDSVILELEGLRDPVVWLDEDHLVFRVNNGQTVADYVYSITGGEPHKIADVSDVPGADDWYYYYD